MVEDFCGPEVDAVTLRASQHHPHLMYVNAALPSDRMRMTLAHELGHLVMDEMTDGYLKHRPLLSLLAWYQLRAGTAGRFPTRHQTNLRLLYRAHHLRKTF